MVINRIVLEHIGALYWRFLLIFIRRDEFKSHGFLSFLEVNSSNHASTHASRNRIARSRRGPVRADVCRHIPLLGRPLPVAHMPPSLL